MKSDAEENIGLVPTSANKKDAGKPGMNSCIKSETKTSTQPKARQRDDEDDGSISMSKQLKSKRKKRTQPKKEKPSTGCAMPSKAELKKMFASSDEENNTPSKSSPKKMRLTRASKKKSEGIEHLLQTGVSMPSRSELKKMFADSDEENNSGIIHLSPDTLNCITSKAIEIITNKPNDLIEEIKDPRLPVVPQKRRKKPDVPHIVSATEKLEILGFNARVGVGDVKYGVDRDSQDDPESPKRKNKRKKRTSTKTTTRKKVNTKQTINFDIPFEKEVKSDATVEYDANCVDFAAKFELPIEDFAKFDEPIDKDDKIAEPVKPDSKSAEPVEEDAKSDDSTKTECYDLNSYPTGPKSFSPIPSTSKDSEIFQRNDLLFQSSIMETTNDDVEIIETPYEIITIIDDNDSPKMIEIGHLETYPEVILDTDSNTELEIINDVTIPSYTSYSDFSNLLHDINEYSNDDCEIIDVDSIIAENNSVLEKFNRKKPSRRARIIDLSKETTICVDDNNDVEIVDISQDNNNNVAKTDSSNQQIAPDSKGNEIEQIISNFFKNYKQTLDQQHQKDAPVNKQSLGLLITNILTAITTTVQTAASYVSSAFPSSNSRSNFEQQNQSIQNPQPPSIPVYNPHTYPSSRYLEPISNINTLQPSLFSNVNPTYPPAAPPQLNHYSYDCVQSNNSSNPFYYPPIYNLNNATNVTNTLHVDSTVVQRRTNKAATSTQVQCAVPVLSPESPKPAGRSLGDCPICMENLANKSIASTICGHIFCMPCIEAVVKTAGGKKCPTCRKPFKKGANFHQIFL